jgi:hypothetical protein
MPECHHASGCLGVARVRDPTPPSLVTFPHISCFHAVDNWAERFISEYKYPAVMTQILVALTDLMVIGQTCRPLMILGLSLDETPLGPICMNNQPAWVPGKHRELNNRRNNSISLLEHSRKVFTVSKVQKPLFLKAAICS